jgi:nucleoside-diphosphate-sugar epimerase
MKVFVAGGTGAIGKQLVPRLAAAGHDVVATTRSERGARMVREMSGQPAIVDGLDEPGILDAVRRVQPEVVIHEMTALAGRPDMRRWDRWFHTTNELRTRGTDYLVRAGQEVGARRLIAQSYAGWPNATEGDAVKTEEDPLNPNPPKWMRESLAAIRHVETTVPAAAGPEGVVLRYGALYARGTGMLAPEILDLISQRRFPVVGDGGGVWSFVNTGDAASATVAALDRGAPGIYNVVDDDPAPTAAWLPHLAS